MKSKSVKSLSTRVLSVFGAICVSSGVAQAQSFSPTTTMSEQTELNTSQSPLFTDRYYDYITKATGATNQDTPNQNISLTPISSLLTGAAAKAKIYIETQSWFCHDASNVVDGKLKDNAVCGSHKDIGYNSGQQAASQYKQMVALGVDGVVVDWDGQGTSSGMVAQNNLAINTFQKLAEESNGKFTFAVSEDEGVARCLKGWSSCASVPSSFLESAPGASSAIKAISAKAEAQAVADINYILKTWAKSPAYMKNAEGQPLVYVFGLDAYTTGECEKVNGVKECASLNWTTIKDNLVGNPVLIFENSAGHAEAGGAYSWNKPMNWEGYTVSSGTASSENYLQDIYSNLLSAISDNKYATASIFKGFDDAIVDGWNAPTGPRYVDQQCGLTWLNTISTINTRFSSKAPDSIWVVTWDDYEEGTETETGIKNCLEDLNTKISGSEVSWSPSFGKSFAGVEGSEETVAEYAIYASLDGSNLMKVATVPTSTHSYNLAEASLPSNNYKVYVQAVGKPNISNFFDTTVLNYKK